MGHGTAIRALNVSYGLLLCTGYWVRAGLKRLSLTEK